MDRIAPSAYGDKSLMTLEYGLVQRRLAVYDGSCGIGLRKILGVRRFRVFRRPIQTLLYFHISVNPLGLYARLHNQSMHDVIKLQQPGINDSLNVLS